MTVKAKRVVVTGVGGWSCLGGSFLESWQAMLKRVDCPAKAISRFDATSFPTTIACEAVADKYGKAASIGEMGAAAAREAVAQAGLTPEYLASKATQWFLGLGMGTPELDWYRDVILKKINDPSAFAPYLDEMPARMGQTIVELSGFNFPVQTFHTACASSAQSIGEAFLALRLGEFDVCLAGGADAMVKPFQLAGFSLLGALSKSNAHAERASRPFALDREGLVIGEGSCVLVMETLASALARGATILAEIVGYGCTESAYRITDLHPEGRGIREAVQMALTMADVKPEDIDYVNAHGTSTIPNDQIESDVIADIFPAETKVSSSKGLFGHMIAAAGAFEAGICVTSISHQLLPQSLFVDHQDPRCAVTLTSRTPENADIQFALSNSIGFGGSNAALLFKRWRNVA